MFGLFNHQMGGYDHHMLNMPQRQMMIDQRHNGLQQPHGHMPMAQPMPIQQNYQTNQALPPSLMGMHGQMMPMNTLIQQSRGLM